MHIIPHHRDVETLTEAPSTNADEVATISGFDSEDDENDEEGRSAPAPVNGSGPQGKWWNCVKDLPPLAHSFVTDEAAAKATRLQMITHAVYNHKGEAAPVPPHVHKSCLFCDRFFNPNELLIMQTEPHFDWQGHLQLICFWCLQDGPTNGSKGPTAVPPTLIPAILGNNRDLPAHQQEIYQQIRQQKRAKLGTVPKDTAAKELLDSLVEKTWRERQERDASTAAAPSASPPSSEPGQGTPPLEKSEATGPKTNEANF